jgi:hypothetical protein
MRIVREVGLADSAARVVGARSVAAFAAMKD